MENREIKYIHTINGQPAFFQKNKQIVYLGSNKPLEVSIMVDSLLQIKKEQIASEEWRISQQFGMDNTEYGYFKINLGLKNWEKEQLH